MNKISSAALTLCLMCAGSAALAMEPMDKGAAMGKDTMGKDTMGKDTMGKDTMKKDDMKKDGAMMKAAPKKMEKKGDKMEPAGSMAMEPKK